MTNYSKAEIIKKGCRDVLRISILKPPKSFIKNESTLKYLSGVFNGSPRELHRILLDKQDDILRPFFSDIKEKVLRELEIKKWDLNDPLLSVWGYEEEPEIASKTSKWFIFIAPNEVKYH